MEPASCRGSEKRLHRMTNDEQKETRRNPYAKSSVIPLDMVADGFRPPEGR
jgi:hypothetical protein